MSAFIGLCLSHEWVNTHIYDLRTITQLRWNSLIRTFREFFSKHLRNWSVRWHTLKQTNKNIHSNCPKKKWVFFRKKKNHYPRQCSNRVCVAPGNTHELAPNCLILRNRWNSMVSTISNIRSGYSIWPCIGSMYGIMMMCLYWTHNWTESLQWLWDLFYIQNFIVSDGN